MSDGQTQAKRSAAARARARFHIQDRYGVVLFLLMVTVFFSISAPNEPWAWLATTLILAVSLMIALEASGAQPKFVRAGLGLTVIGISASVIIAATQAGDARRYLSLTSVLLTLLAMAAIVERVRMHPEISLLTVLGAVCFYVLLGLTFAFVYELIGEFGSRPFFASGGAGTRSDYVYFSFVTMATVGYGDLTAQGGLGRALAVTEGLAGQIYLVTAVAALVGNLGRTRAPLRGTEDEASEEEETGSA